MRTFTFWTDVTTIAPYTQVKPGTIKSQLGGVEGSVLDQYGGEYEWDNFTVKLHNQRGSLAINNGITLRYGKNITDISQEENIAETATGVVPYWADYDGNIVTLTEKAVYSPYASRYSQHLTVPLDLSDKWENAPTENDLRTAAQVVANSMGLPKVSIEVSFVALWQTEEYKEIAPLQRVKLCDEVSVHFEKLGIDVTAKIVRTDYDVLREKYNSVQIGSVRSNLAQTLNDQAMQTAQTIAAQSVSTQTAINNATKWLTTVGGYVIAVKNDDGSWQELLFVDKADPSEAKHGLRINDAGIGFWNKDKDGGNIWEGPYNDAWTIDGSLNASWIHGGTLTLGGNNNVNGWMRLLDANGTQTGKWDNQGLDVNDNIGHCKIQSGAITLNANSGRSLLKMYRDSDNTHYEVSLNSTDVRYQVGGVSAQVDWQHIVDVANYFDEHGGWA